MKHYKIVLILGSSLLIVSVTISIIAYCYELSLLSICSECINWFVAIMGVLIAVRQYQLNADIDASRYIFELHQKFISQTEIFDLYKTLDSHENIDIKERKYAIMLYASYFDFIYLLLKNKAIKIADVDDVFSYYFLIMFDNKKIRAEYLEPNKDYYSKTYALYDMLSKYRKKNGLPLDV